MTWPFLAWSPDDSAGAVYDVTVPGTWDELVEFYAGGAGSRPLERVVEIARGHGVRSVVVEQRYLDPDWRSEHGAFHGRLFRRHPSVCHRWHLFTDDVPADLSELRPEAYRGYVVLRPLPSTPVGRTMIAPPRRTRGGDPLRGHRARLAVRHPAVDHRDAVPQPGRRVPALRARDALDGAAPRPPRPRPAAPAHGRGARRRARRGDRRPSGAQRGPLGAADALGRHAPRPVPRAHAPARHARGGRRGRRGRGARRRRPRWARRPAGRAALAAGGAVPVRQQPAPAAGDLVEPRLGGRRLPPRPATTVA